MRHAAVYVLSRHGPDIPSVTYFKHVYICVADLLFPQWDEFIDIPCLVQRRQWRANLYASQPWPCNAFYIRTRTKDSLSFGLLRSTPAFPSRFFKFAMW